MKGTIAYLHSLIFLENFFCINRNYLFKSRTVKKFCHIISLTATIITIGSIFYDIFITRPQFGIAMGISVFISTVELLFLALTAKNRRVFEAIKRLDEKCGIAKEYTAKLKSKVRKTTALNFVSVLLNFGLSVWCNLDVSVTVLLSVATSAHDAEMDTICLLIEGFNIRLSKVQGETPSAGSRVYRHVLMTTNHLAEEFLRVLVMLAVTLLKIVIDVVLAVLVDTDPMLVVLILWRQMRSMYSLWMLCLAAYETKNICNNLSFHTATRLVFDIAANKVKHRKFYDSTRRLHRSVLKERPRYMSGAVDSIDLKIPVIIFDISVNYLLIIVQVYAASK